MDVVRETTRTLRSFERFEMISSVSPSLKYSCSGSLLILMNGNTRIPSERTFSPLPSRLLESGIFIPALLTANISTCSFTFLRIYFPSETVLISF
jgi:hypothetical protein